MSDAALACPEHLDERVTGTCARCGRFVCERCSRTDVAVQLFCLACGARRAGELVAHPGLDLLAGRAVLEPTAHALAVLAVCASASIRGTWPPFAIAFVIFELAILGTSIWTAVRLMGAKRDAIALCQRQLMLGTVSIVAATLLLASHTELRFALLFGGPLLILQGATSMPILRLLRSPAARDRFVR